MIHIFILVFSLLCNFYTQTLIRESIFRQYDIRGIVGQDFDVADAYDIGLSIATYFSRSNNTIKTVAVGADARIHSPAIKLHIEQALRERGYDVISIGTCATPVLYFTMHTQPVDAGIVITASHNPGNYNGFKVCIGKQSLYGSHIQELKKIYFNRLFIQSQEMGTYRELDMNSRYVDYLVTEFNHLRNCNLSMVIDCGNGAAGTIIPELIHRMGWNNAHILYAELDGTYPHHIADPTIESNMTDLKNEVIARQAAVGIGFDGDVDRMAPVTPLGRLIKGDALLALHAKKMIQQHSNLKVVCDVTSSKSLYDAVNQWGGQVIMSPTGAVFIKNNIKEHNALLGGEISCHTVFADRYFGFDDGFYSMMRLIELLDGSTESLDEMYAQIPSMVSSPTYRIPCDKQTCQNIVDALIGYYTSVENAQLITIDGVRIHVPHGWAIVRASNTEPLISIRIEGIDAESLQSIKDELNKIIQPLSQSIRL